MHGCCKGGSVHSGRGAAGAHPEVSNPSCCLSLLSFDTRRSCRAGRESAGMSLPRRRLLGCMQGLAPPPESRTRRGGGGQSGPRHHVPLTAVIPRGRAGPTVRDAPRTVGYRDHATGDECRQALHVPEHAVCVLRCGRRQETSVARSGTVDGADNLERTGGTKLGSLMSG